MTEYTELERAVALAQEWEFAFREAFARAATLSAELRRRDERIAELEAHQCSS